jgi:hypothetical protein
VSPTRRELLMASLVPALAWIAHARAWAADPVLQRWMRRLDEIGRSVRSGAMSPLAWQEAMQELYADLPPEELVAFIDMDRLLSGLRYPAERLGAVTNVPWERAEGSARLVPKLFVYRKGSSTPPHVHNHLVSAHWILRGEIRTRTFDRVEDLERSILLRPTRDEILRPGALVTMSDARDNAHWFEGKSELSISFDVPIGDITPDKTYQHPAEGQNQIFVDPTAPPRADGTIEAPILKFEDSVRKFAG